VYPPDIARCCVCLFHCSFASKQSDSFLKMLGQRWSGSFESPWESKNKLLFFSSAIYCLRMQSLPADVLCNWGFSKHRFSYTKVFQALIWFACIQIFLRHWYSLTLRFACTLLYFWKVEIDDRTVDDSLIFICVCKGGAWDHAKI
jgi:hypothetical protein